MRVGKFCVYSSKWKIAHEQRELTKALYTYRTKNRNLKTESYFTEFKNTVRQTFLQIFQNNSTDIRSNDKSIFKFRDNS